MSVAARIALIPAADHKHCYIHAGMQCNIKVFAPMNTDNFKTPFLNANGCIEHFMYAWRTHVFCYALEIGNAVILNNFENTSIYATQIIFISGIKYNVNIKHTTFQRGKSMNYKNRRYNGRVFSIDHPRIGLQFQIDTIRRGWGSNYSRSC